MSGSFEGKAAPDTKGISAELTEFSTTTDSQRVTPLTRTSSILLVAPNNNSDPIYIDFGSTVDTNVAIPLQPGSSLNLDLNVQQESIYGKASTVGDQIRFLGTR